MLLRDNTKNLKETDPLYYLAVMSAAKKFSWKLIKKLLKIKNMRFATPEEVYETTRCLPGAVPPFGHIWEVPTLVDESLRAQGDTINFNCGLRTHSIRMSVHDYLEVEKPKVIGVFTEEGENGDE
jgi:Ala-tRNA(Pro) deacylase